MKILKAAMQDYPLKSDSMKFAKKACSSVIRIQGLSHDQSIMVIATKWADKQSPLSISNKTRVVHHPLIPDIVTQGVKSFETHTFCLQFKLTTWDSDSSVWVNNTINNFLKFGQLYAHCSRISEDVCYLGSKTIMRLTCGHSVYMTSQQFKH